MGIKDLNKITSGMTTYTGKFNTIIVDALNMYHIYIDGPIKNLTKNNGYSNNSIINQLSYIVSECSGKIYIYLLSLIKLLVTKGTIYLVFDPIGDPKYEFLGGEILDLKTDERKTRKTNQEKQNKSNEIKDTLDLKYGLDKKISEIEDWKKILKNIDKSFGIDTITIEEVFNQQYYFTQHSSQMILMELIVERAIQKIKNVDIQCIFSESEADLVIKNIAYMRNSQPVLVSSRDSDYLSLLAELPNVYKSEVTGIVQKGIYYPYEIWKQQFGENITPRQIYALSTIAGNDYTVHESLLAFNVKKYKELMNVDNSFKSLRCQKLKKLIDFEPEGMTTIEELESVIVSDKFKKSYEAYKAWHLNGKMSIKNLDFDKIIERIINKLTTKFEKIYDFDVYDNCIYNVKEVTLTVEDFKEILLTKNKIFSESSEDKDELLIEESDD